MDENERGLTNVHSKELARMNANAKKERAAAPFVPLDMETRRTLDTASAAVHLGRRPHTLRVWACEKTYPACLKPIRVNGRLAWPVAGIREALGLLEPA